MLDDLPVAGDVSNDFAAEYGSEVFNFNVAVAVGQDPMPLYAIASSLNMLSWSLSTEQRLDIGLNEISNSILRAVNGIVKG
jgi:hypothetical protein